jgi:AcrR family transcriptional regulator
MARKLSLDGGPSVAEEILTGAARLFYDRGYDATSIRDLAETIGVSSSTLYHHYTNKQEILRAVLHRFMVNFNAAIIPVLRDPTLSATKRVREATRMHLEITDERRPELLRFTQFRNVLDEAQLRPLIQLQWDYHDAVKSVIKEGRDTGEFTVDDVDLATMAILDMLNGVRSWFSHSGALSMNDVVQRYVTMIDKLLS